MSVRFHVVIPARYGSKRFPGKPLAALAGSPMIVHACRRARESGAEEVWVATDDARIAQVVTACEVDVAMTSPEHASGTDRLAEVAAQRGWDDRDIVINLQGDEPLMPPHMLGDLAAQLDAHPDAGIATVAVPITHHDDVWNPNVVKVVRDSAGFALYFSRAPIPWLRDSYGSAGASEVARCTLRHLGLYGYRVATLRRFAAASPGTLELSESLEQLRALEMGIKIHVSVLQSAPPPGVDTPEDLARAEAALLS